MTELAYPIDHPKHPDNEGKKFPETRTTHGFDYAPNHPARGGQGQPVLLMGVENHPADGYKHLHGLPGATLAEVTEAYKALPKEERAARWQWNKTGIPVEPEKGA